MGETSGLLRDMAVALAAALAAGVACQRLRQPVLVGYLLAGMAIGPFGLGLIGDERSVQHLAELGVILLMFALGVEFSLAQFRPVRWLVLTGGAAYVVLGAALAAAAAIALGAPPRTGLLGGFVFALSSTIIVMRILIDGRAVDAVHGKTMLGWLILQDLAVVPMLIGIPYLADGSGAATLGLPLLVALAKIALFLGATYTLGVTAFPWLLSRLARTAHQELFFLGVIALLIGTAATSAAFGLSLALGAFLAGLVVSQSDEHRQVLADVLPLRDLFVTLFFVSIGMLIDPAFVWAHAGPIAGLALAIMAGKALLGTTLALGLALSWRSALLIGLGLAQIGEFSFVVAREGRDHGLLTGEQFSLLLAAALVTMLLTPTLMRLAPLVAARAARWLPAGHDPAHEPEPRLRHHVVLVGYGRVGGVLGEILHERGVPFLVVDLDRERLDALARRGVPTLYGDAAMGEVLVHAHLEGARLLVVAMPDPSAAQLVVRHARGLSPELEIVVAAHAGDAPAQYLGVGAAEVIQPETEAARALVRSCLVRLGWSPNVIQYYLARLRAPGSARDMAGALAGLADSPDGTAAMWLSLAAPGLEPPLRQADVAARTGVQVLLVRPHGHAHAITHPPGDQPLRPGDALLVLGTPTQLAAVVRLLAGAGPATGPAAGPTTWPAARARPALELTERPPQDKNPRPPRGR